MEDSIFDFETIQKLYEQNVLQHYSAFERFLRLDQAKCIHASLNRFDVACITKTGSGKTLGMIAPTIIIAKKRGGKPCQLIIGPLKSLMRDTQQRLTGRNLTCMLLDETNTKDSHMVLAAVESLPDKTPIFFLCAAELLETAGFKCFVKRFDFVNVTVDECHTIITWGRDFRRSYGKICNLRANLSVPISVFTGTLTPSMLNDIVEKGGLRKQKLIKIISSPDRPEIYLELRTKQIGFKSLQFLVDEANALKTDMPRTIVFAKSVAKITSIFFWLRSQLVNKGRIFNSKGEVEDYMVEMYHGSTDEKTKRRIEHDFSVPRSNVTILCATIAFGMGIDTKAVKKVIIWDVVDEPTTLFQEIGRCSRDGLPGHAILFSPAAPKSNAVVADMQKFCIRKAITKHFCESTTNIPETVEVVHDGCTAEKCQCRFCSCCSFCKKGCNCVYNV